MSDVQNTRHMKQDLKVLLLVTLDVGVRNVTMFCQHPSPRRCKSLSHLNCRQRLSSKSH
ncbi:hypothetical protein Plhal304r1_c024g0082921 [Plasmopara halstedii]